MIKRNCASNCILNIIKHSIFVLIFCSSSAYTYFENAASCMPTLSFCFDPYIGVNAGMRYMNWPRNFGGNVFKREYPEGDLYLGTNFNQYFGFQFGYKTTTTRYQFSSLSNDIDLGLPTEPGPQIDLTRAQFKGWHGEFIGYVPVLFPDCLYLYGTLGLTRFELFQKDNILEVGTNPPGTPIRLAAAGRTFKRNRTVFSMSLGIETFIDEKFGFRVFAAWDNLARFKSIPAQEFTSPAVLQLKNSYTYGIGLVMRFY